jgi:deoxyribodipyrimidine photo-lyase
LVHEPSQIPSRTGKVYEVYTPFSKAWVSLPKPPALPMPSPADLARMRLPVATIASPEAALPSPESLGVTLPAQPIVPVGEQAALDRLESFLHKPVRAYKDDRNLLAPDGTSLISPYLRWGMISPRTCYWQAHDLLKTTHDPEARAGIEHWISEVVWREFNYAIMISYPHVVRKNFRPMYDSVRWGNNMAWLEAWQRGQTGYPVVDAAIQQLLQTGWMHNRARMIVASFLCKDLLIDWRYGERFFMQHLLDGDVANNVGGWQWTAGTGTDAAPYFRIFNPLAQSEKFDAAGVFIRRWLPALKDVPNAYIHAPHTMPLTAQQAANCIIGADYPAPIVQHDVQREQALKMYAASKDGKGLSG